VVSLCVLSVSAPVFSQELKLPQAEHGIPVSVRPIAGAISLILARLAGSTHDEGCCLCCVRSKPGCMISTLWTLLRAMRPPCIA
jgi:hypothetical protein